MRRRRAGRLGLIVAGCGLLGVAVLFVVNGCYQVIRKPTELLGLVGPSSPKGFRGTWQEYGPLFRKHSTDIVRPELLAALVQVESGGDPLARTYWRWRWSLNPFEIYAPASSAVGLLQITDAAFEEARRLCIHDHTVARKGPWYDPDSCWFNVFYSRSVPSHSIEMTAARLHHVVVETLHEHRMSRTTLAQKQSLAAVIQLCGAQRGAAFADRGFRVTPGERCGDHDLAAYLSTVRRLTQAFARLDRPA